MNLNVLRTIQQLINKKDFKQLDPQKDFRQWVESIKHTRKQFK
jgi:hypothetical protein